MGSSNIFKKWGYISQFLARVVDNHFIHLFKLSLRLLELAHWVMLLSSSGINDEFAPGIIR